MAPIIDLDGNSLIQMWFTQATEQLSLEVQSDIETHITNPFNYLLEPWALKLPFDYPSSVFSQLQPYLKSYSITADPIALQLAQEIAQEVQGNPQSFLTALNQRIHKHCQYIVREDGDPWLPGMTWKAQQGSCRDLVVLFMDVCRAMGLATRFVSGYQEGDRDQDKRDLHAWVEVYLPGGGWRGYDPTLALMVTDRHMALVASPLPSYTAPVLGAVTPPVASQLETHISIQIQSDEMG